MPREYDPDDNFGNAFDPEAELDEEAALEAIAWQLLLFINPGDEDGALQQFGRVREALSEGFDPVRSIREAIDWKAGFFVDEDDTAALIDVLDELAARFDIRIDWGTDDTSDEDWLADMDATTLLGIAYDRLREHHYTLWTWETGEPLVAGWITLQRDEEALPPIAAALGFHARPANA